MKNRAPCLWMINLAVLISLLSGCQKKAEAPTPATAQNDQAILSAGNVISANAIRAHMSFLADDLLEGRGPVSRGYEITANYAKAQFEAIGLRGGGEAGSYFQSVPLRRGEAVPEGCALVLEGPSGKKPLKFQTDYVFWDHQAGTQREVTAPVVFAGFGVTAPEQGYDDYAGVDAKGKIVAVLSNAPASLPTTLRAYYGEDRVKQKNAVAHGAVALIDFSTIEDEKRGPWPFIVRETQIGWSSLRWIDKEGRPNGLLEALRIVASLSRPGAEALFSEEAHSLEEIRTIAQKAKPPAFPLSKCVTIRRQSRHTAVNSVNVLALIEGSDPKLRSEYVVYSAHLDHLGIGPDVDGDKIYNGAVDNASGCAILMEIARAFSALPGPPKRSVLLLLATGEEAGLLGSDYFATQPTVPREQIVADINIDGGINSFPNKDVIAFGEEHSNLKPLIRRVAADVGLEVSPDPFPEEGFFVRTDLYSFVRKGIPGVYLSVGLQSLDPKIDGLAIARKWLVTKYHSPKDDMSQPFNFESSVRLGRLAFFLGRAVATQNDRPQWNQGDFFGREFGNQKP